MADKFYPTSLTNYDLDRALMMTLFLHDLAMVNAVKNYGRDSEIYKELDVSARTIKHYQRELGHDKQRITRYRS